MNDDSMVKAGALGGYPGWEALADGNALYPDAYCFQSARHALQALLEARRPSRLWVPWLCCQELLAAAAGVPIGRYGLTDDLQPVPNFKCGKGELILLVNYFGVADESIAKALTRFDPGSVIVDCAQALFYEPPSGVDAIYSPRKFCGVPSGGLLITNAPINMPAATEPVSTSDVAHLILRREQGAEAGYASFLAAEGRFSSQQPMRMGWLSANMLSHLNFGEIRQRRKSIFKRYQSRLNLGVAVSGEPASPLTFPVAGGMRLREFLAKRRIYTPQYWKFGVQPECKISKRCSDQLVHLPTTQGLEDKDVDYIINQVLIFKDISQ